MNAFCLHVLPGDGDVQHAEREEGGPAGGAGRQREVGLPELRPSVEPQRRADRRPHGRQGRRLLLSREWV